MRWKIKPELDEIARKKLSDFNDIEAQILFNRGITNSSDALKFFTPDINDLQSPDKIFGAKKAAKQIVKALKAHEKIVIYGDYDVDGISATSILFDYLYRDLKADVVPYVPDRFEEGYGLSKIGLDNVLELGAKLVITVDCGIKDAKLIKKYTDKNLKFIVSDHHTIPVDKKSGDFEVSKTALAVVHPSLDKKYKYNNICATTVVWKLVQLIHEEAAKHGLSKKEINFNKYLDIVALATVCDIMPLKDENRIIVNEGLKLIHNHEENFGIKALSNIAQVNSDLFDAYHFGFVIGPRLNAAGRIEHALDGVRLLTSKDDLKIRNLASKLNDLNFKRQQITKKMLEEAMVDAQKQVDEGKKLIFVSSDTWNEGIVGLVASKINEKFHLPVLVANFSDGFVKGSARSINGFDITNAISLNAELLEKFGGHNQAAGFKLKELNFDKFKSNIQEYASLMITPEMISKELNIDLVITTDDATMDTIKSIAKFKPFGYGNPEPIVVVKDTRIYGTPTAIGQDKRHLKFSILSSNHEFISVIGFNMIDKIDTIKTDSLYDLAGVLDINVWNGRTSIQIILRDLKPSDKKTGEKD